MAAGDVRAEVAWLAAGQQDPVDDRMERRGGGRDAGERGDRLRGDVGLLGGDTAVLDRKISRVARGPDAVDTGHLAVNVDRDETADRTPGHPGHGGTVKLRHRDDAISLKVPRARIDRNVTRLGNLAVGRGDRHDPVVLQQLPHAVAGSVDDSRGLDYGRSFLMRQAGSLGGGSTEMARNIISERVLGMPREFAADRDVPFSQVRQGR